MSDVYEYTARLEEGKTYSIGYVISELERIPYLKLGHIVINEENYYLITKEDLIKIDQKTRSMESEGKNVYYRHREVKKLNPEELEILGQQVDKMKLEHKNVYFKEVTRKDLEKMGVGEFDILSTLMRREKTLSKQLEEEKNAISSTKREVGILTREARKASESLRASIIKEHEKKATDLELELKKVQAEIDIALDLEKKENKKFIYYEEERKISDVTIITVVDIFYACIRKYIDFFEGIRPTIEKSFKESKSQKLIDIEDIIREALKMGYFTDVKTEDKFDYETGKTETYRFGLSPKDLDRFLKKTLEEEYREYKESTRPPEPQLKLPETISPKERRDAIEQHQKRIAKIREEFEKKIKRDIASKKRNLIKSVRGTGFFSCLNAYLVRTIRVSSRIVTVFNWDEGLTETYISLSVWGIKEIAEERAEEEETEVEMEAKKYEQYAPFYEDLEKYIVEKLSKMESKFLVISTDDAIREGQKFGFALDSNVDRSRFLKGLVYHFKSDGIPTTIQRKQIAFEKKK